MASRIKGITVEIGGDTTGLEKALKSVNSTIRNTQSQLKDVTKLLKLDPKNTELLSQKQRLLKDAISATKDKLEALKEAQKQAKEQLENGTLGQDKYDALQREIVETEEELRRLKKENSNTVPIRRVQEGLYFPDGIFLSFAVCFFCLLPAIDVSVSGTMPCCPAALYVPRKMIGYGAFVRTVLTKSILNRIAMTGRVKRVILGKRQNTDAMSVRKAQTPLQHGFVQKGTVS